MNAVGSEGNNPGAPENTKVGEIRSVEVTSEVKIKVKYVCWLESIRSGGIGESVLTSVAQRNKAKIGCALSRV